MLDCDFLAKLAKMLIKIQCRNSFLNLSVFVFYGKLYMRKFNCKFSCSRHIIVYC